MSPKLIMPLPYGVEEWAFAPSSIKKRKLEIDSDLLFDPPPTLPSGHVDLDNVDPFGIFFLNGDSWFTQERLAAIYRTAANLEMGPFVPTVDCISMSPHVVDQGEHNTPPTHDLLRSLNYSRGGKTFADVLGDVDALRAWAFRRPVMSLFHVGACDLASPMIGNPIEYGPHWFYDKVVQVARWYRSQGLQYCQDQVSRDFVNYTPLVFSYLPDWGLAFQPRTEHHPSAATVRTHRNAMNCYTKRQVGNLWNDTRVIMVSLNLNNPVRHGVHLDGRSLTDFATLVQRVAARHCCIRCKITHHHYLARAMSRNEMVRMSQEYLHYYSCDRPEGGPLFR